MLENIYIFQYIGVYWRRDYCEEERLEKTNKFYFCLLLNMKKFNFTLRMAIIPGWLLCKIL